MLPKATKFFIKQARVKSKHEAEEDEVVDNSAEENAAVLKRLEKNGAFATLAEEGGVADNFAEEADEVDDNPAKEAEKAREAQEADQTVGAGYPPKRRNLVKTNWAVNSERQDKEDDVVDNPGGKLVLSWTKRSYRRRRTL